MLITNIYRQEWNIEGLLVAIYKDATGQQLYFYPNTKTFDENHPLTIELRENEDLYGVLDLSDKPPEPKNNGKKKG